MGRLRRYDGIVCLLEAEHPVGRSRFAVLRIDESYISTQHALIRWTGSNWELKDLGSRNGTWVDDVLVKPGQAVSLCRGGRLCFGSREQAWELEDDGPPRPMVVPLDGGAEPLFIVGDILPLPSPEDPKETVFRSADGAWHLEREDGVVELAPNSVFESCGRRYRFSCPDVAPETSTFGDRPSWPCDLSSVRLLFRVSRDEEHVEVLAERGGDRIDLGSRVHNYTLLLLARQRLSDAGAGAQEAACGWIYQDDFVRALKTTPERLNMDIYRIRKQFAGIGVCEPARIVERRQSARQLRIGAARLVIDTI